MNSIKRLPLWWPFFLELFPAIRLIPHTYCIAVSGLGPIVLMFNLQEYKLIEYCLDNEEKLKNLQYALVLIIYFMLR